MANKTLLVIDGNSLINREYYGMPPLTSKSGEHTNAILGFVNRLTKYLDSLSPDFAAVAFDLPAPTFRHRLYAGYKASRKPMPEELAAQLPYVKEVCGIFGLAVVSEAGYEADDILGTLAKKASENEGDKIKTYIVTGDRDSFQLISDNVTVIYCSNTGAIEFTPQKISETYNLEPSQLIDVKALMGDSSDEIPGVRGIGEKTALKLICENGSLDSVYENLDSGSLQLAPAAKQKLADGRADAYMSQNLAQICCEVPLKAEALPKRNEPNKAKLYDFCTALDLFSVIKKLNLSPAQNEQIQLDFGDDIFDMLEDLNEKKPDSSEASVRYDLLPIAELPGKFAAGALLFAELDFDSGSLYINDNFSFYKSTFGEISELFPLFSGKFDICSNHIKTIYHKFMRANIEISQESIKFDFELAGYALDPSETKYDIQSLAYKYLGLNLFDKPDFVENSIYPALYFAMMQKLKDQGLENLYYNVELPLAFVLGDMEQKGFLADIESLQKFGEELNFKAGETQEEIYRLAGTEFNINSPKQLGEVLFEKLKLPFGKKNKTGYSTNIDVMQKLKPLHPAIAPILEYRAITKLKSTYCDGLVKLSDVGGRLHTSFNQAITATGRLSSTEPNLQNIPVRTELGKNIRKFFIAEKGYMLVDADYSQIELRILAHLSGDEGLIGAFWDNRDIHRLTASQVFGVSESEVNPEMRQMAKAVNFGIIYGMSDFSLSEDIGVSVKEARAYIESYFATYPKVKIFIDETIANAKTNGYVKTMLGRIRYIPELKLSNRNLASFGERVARNTPIQGSAADIIKLAMLACHRRLAKEKLKSSLILQVHDELIFETAEDEIEIVSKLAKEEMENAYKLNVPLVADVSAGKSWHEAKK